MSPLLISQYKNTLPTKSLKNELKPLGSYDNKADKKNNDKINSIRQKKYPKINIYKR